MGRRQEIKKLVDGYVDDFIWKVFQLKKAKQRHITPAEVTDLFLQFCAVQRIDRPQDGSLRDHILTKVIKKLDLKLRRSSCSQ